MVQNGLTPVTRLNHGHRYWRRFTSFEFARHLPECPVVEPEILQAAAAFPIAFRVVSGEVEAVALLSVHAAGSTPFVSDEGTWLAQYLPSALRCPPFQVDLTGAQSEPQPAGCLMVDETLGLVTDDPRDECFFDADGKLTPELVKVQRFLCQRAAAKQNTLTLCRVIQGMNLFSPLDQLTSVECPDGLLGVSLRAVHSLPQSHKSLLTNSGALRLIHAHQVSLSHVAWLTQAQRQMVDRASGRASSEISGFLDAVVGAQAKEHAFGLNQPEGVQAYV